MPLYIFINTPPNIGFNFRGYLDYLLKYDLASSFFRTDDYIGRSDR